MLEEEPGDVGVRGFNVRESTRITKLVEATGPRLLISAITIAALLFSINPRSVVPVRVNTRYRSFNIVSREYGCFFRSSLTPGYHGWCTWYRELLVGTTTSQRFQDPLNFLHFSVKLSFKAQVSWVDDITRRRDVFQR